MNGRVVCVCVRVCVELKATPHVQRGCAFDTSEMSDVDWQAQDVWADGGVEANKLRIQHEDQAFIPARKKYPFFTESILGMIFKLGARGLGYYIDAPPSHSPR